MRTLKLALPPFSEWRLARPRRSRLGWDLFQDDLRGKAMADGETVVVIDDDNNVSEVLGGLLEIFGYPVKIYLSGQAFMADTTVKPGCLIVDQNMPNMSGLDLIAKLRAEHHAVPTILITGMPDPDVMAGAKELGVTKVLTKPMSHDDLLAEIEECLHR
jgi:two-component system, chemotaxis family, CheB/CheR fusion protein